MVSRSGSGCAGIVPAVQAGGLLCEANGKDRIQVYEGGINEESQDKETGYEQVAPTVYALVAAIDAKDSFTFQHSTNVSQYAVLLAQKLGLSRNDIQTVKVAGLCMILVRSVSRRAS